MATWLSSPSAHSSCHSAICSLWTPSWLVLPQSTTRNLGISWLFLGSSADSCMLQDCRCCDSISMLQSVQKSWGIPCLPHWWVNFSVFIVPLRVCYSIPWELEPIQKILQKMRGIRSYQSSTTRISMGGYTDYFYICSVLPRSMAHSMLPSTSISQSSWPTPSPHGSLRSHSSTTGRGLHYYRENSF